MTYSIFGPGGAATPYPGPDRIGGAACSIFAWVLALAYKSQEDQRRAARAHYEANRDQYIARARAHNIEQGEKIRGLIREAKNAPCTDCGVRYPFYVMQFDHRDGEVKRFTIGAIGSRCSYSLETVRCEIAKCDVVCANCHAERTYRREQRFAVGLRLVAGAGFEPALLRVMSPASCQAAPPRVARPG